MVSCNGVLSCSGVAVWCDMMGQCSEVCMV